MAPPPLVQPLLDLAASWRSATASARRRVAFVAVALSWTVALTVARHGTARARVIAACLMGASVVLAVAWRVAERRRISRPADIVRRLALRAAPEHAERALRALSLVGPDGEARADAGTSPDLARIHVMRAFERLPRDRILERAARVSGRVGVVAFVAALAVAGVAAWRAWSLAEGADVLVARRGVAPVSLRWLDEVDVVARPPEYVHQPERHLFVPAPQTLPYGTEIVVRGAPVRAGRSLFLGDGSRAVPFVEDGAGGVVARWTLTSSASLRAFARFGDVAVEEPDSLMVESVPDQSPSVSVEGAPRRIALVDQTEDPSIKYEASDDYGLREVDLVLRSGPREERRILARLDGETREDRGGYVLRLRDPFVRSCHVPIEVTVEAKDNDPLTGPKWGRSAAITLVPPAVGEAEARVLEGLERLRDALVDALAWRLSVAPPGRKADVAAYATEARRRADADADAVSRALAENHGGLRVPSRVRGVLLAQDGKLRAAVDRELQSPSARTHAPVVAANERFVLVTDAVVRGLGLRDARDAARLLADVADDLALGAEELKTSPPGSDGASRANGRMDAASVVLQGGGGALDRMGALGRDLGEIVGADLLRVQRARDGVDWMHAELAARDLATRLHQPDPSFGARGGSVGRAGGESGGAQGADGEEGAGDDVEQAFEEAARDIEQLAQDHAGEIAKTERSLADATSDDEREQLREEARRHAAAIRDAVRDLPNIGNGSDSWTSKGAAARELAEQMARSLEETRAEEAAENGRGAIGALDQATQMLKKEGWLDDPSGEGARRVEDARKKIDGEQRWLEKALELARRRGADRARDDLAREGDEERKLAERARDVAQRARQAGAVPDSAADSVEDAEQAAREAADALARGDADRGLERQREAQRRLEAAQDELRGDDDDETRSPGDRGDGSDTPWSRSRVDVPKPGEHKGPEDFRRRVVRGLGESASDGLRDAVRRYAEGLLR